MPTLTLPTPPRFDLARTVCSYGYFLLAPNFWDPAAATLSRPLRLPDGSPVDVVISQATSADRRLKVALEATVRGSARALVLGQVARMLRLDEDDRPWRRTIRRVDPALARVAIGRMFRSPTLFEDLVKTVTSCNVNWPNTRAMNRRLCLGFGGGAFPTPAQLAAASEAQLRAHARVGYRAGRIRELARRVADGELDLDALDDPRRPTDELFASFAALPGIGPYAAGNLCHLVGRYDRLAIDTETRRHFCLRQGVDRPAPTDAAANRTLDRRIAEHYAAADPFAFKYFWAELWADYQRRNGPAHAWDRATTGASFTASVLRKQDAAGG
ncbi:DNA-3-methyladenine glycosylase family protein [Phycisphaera mikurensis]|uniref:DNA-(apurinic or apyrimidinic site) lyase n=1 Tax=Phycisphaera mikurensis (strain NBRC 102666 / KCTC 22515 / FYK2301M01) TaxID=1142394 RepID=I0IH14_PHYMF|nr:endonuclease III domain-containing protein [Phycisphaera mikurensis]MBB6440807.1 3-methyladenine DNA glycosylase/8-oxoguanine DNA glycosylase [Phycisphaera mikurensis]BAM04552.1 hypothetical protein PSMK_23930 [Phycisphaera mikurensis NBRC 102666]